MSKFEKLLDELDKEGKKETIWIISISILAIIITLIYCFL